MSGHFRSILRGQVRDALFRQQNEPPAPTGPLVALQLQKGWGTALHVQEYGKASPRGGFRERWKADCTWRLDEFLLVLHHISGLTGCSGYALQ